MRSENVSDKIAQKEKGDKQTQENVMTKPLRCRQSKFLGSFPL